MRGATSATAGSQKCPSSASSQPRRGTTSESRNATKSVSQAASPVLRAAAGPLLRGVAQHPDVAVQAVEVARPARACDEPSSTTTTRMPRSAATSRLSPMALSRTGMTTVTSRCDGPLAGRGWATVASSRVRASCALCASCTSSRPPLSIVCAAGASRSSRVGEPPRSAEPSPEHPHPPVHLHGEPVGQPRSRSLQASPRAPGVHAATRRAQSVDHLSKDTRTLGGRRRGGVPQHPDRADRGDAAARAAGASARPAAPRCPATHSSMRTRPPAKYVAIQTFRCGRRGRRRPATLQAHHATSRPSSRSSVDGAQQRPRRCRRGR